MPIHGPIHAHQLMIRFHSHARYPNADYNQLDPTDVHMVLVAQSLRNTSAFLCVEIIDYNYN